MRRFKWNNRIFGGKTDVKVFEGVTDKSNVYQYSATASTGLTFSHLQSDGGSIMRSSTTAGHNHFKVTNLTADSPININTISSSTRLIKTMSLTRTKQGTDGTNVKLLIGSLDSQVMFDDSSDTTS